MEKPRERSSVGSEAVNTWGQRAMLTEWEFQEMLKKAVACQPTAATADGRYSKNLARRDVNSEK